MGRPFFFMAMNIRSSPGRRSRAERDRRLFAIILTLLSLSACTPASTPTPFRPPTAQAPLIEPTFIIHPTQQKIIIQSTPLPTLIPTIDPQKCSNNLKFVQDLTIPDDTIVSAGLAFDKQWLVENNGTCNWSSGYRLKHVGGAVLGAPEEVALYPARAGTQATIQIRFTAPFTEGVYESAWQAFDADGTTFGDLIYVRVTVE